MSEEYKVNVDLADVTWPDAGTITARGVFVDGQHFWLNQQEGPTRLRTERRDGPFGPFDLLVAPVLREVDGAVVDTGERETLMIDPIRPIPLSERKPGEGDCDGDLVWAGRKQPGLPYWEWTLDAWLGNDFMASGEEFTHWLPASTKYLPARVDQ